MLALPAALMLGGAAQAQVNAATAAVFSKPAMLGMQLSLKAGAKQGKVTPEQLKCAQGLDPGDEGIDVAVASAVVQLGSRGIIGPRLQ